MLWRVLGYVVRLGYLHTHAYICTTTTTTVGCSFSSSCHGPVDQQIVRLYCHESKGEHADCSWCHLPKVLQLRRKLKLKL